MTEQTLFQSDPKPVKIARSSGWIEKEVIFINEGRLFQGLGAAMEKALSPLDSERIII